MSTDLPARADSLRAQCTGFVLATVVRAQSPNTCTGVAGSTDSRKMSSVPPDRHAVSIVAELVSVRASLHPPAPPTEPPRPAPDMRLPHRAPWYFCGPGCRQAFAADPGRYAA